MGCGVFCAVAAALVGGNIAVCSSSDSSVRRAGLLRVLGPSLRKSYERSVGERRLLYYTGLGWGLLCAALISYARRGMGSRPLHAGCLAAAVTLGVAYLYYMLMPKRHSVGPRLQTEQQKAAWHEVHKLFQRNYIIGLCLGALAGGFLGSAMCAR